MCLAVTLAHQIYELTFLKQRKGVLGNVILLLGMSFSLVQNNLSLMPTQQVYKVYVMIHKE